MNKLLHTKSVLTEKEKWKKTLQIMYVQNAKSPDKYKHPCLSSHDSSHSF